VHATAVRCREFLLSNYAEIKKANPGFPVLVREAAGTEAKLIARYGEQHQHHVQLSSACTPCLQHELPS
jgi:NADH dehydrogenase (ubiquinone) 1 alpha subcomplex subunit 2